MKPEACRLSDDICLLPKIIRADTPNFGSAPDGDGDRCSAVGDQRVLFNRRDMVEVDQKAAVAADELSGRETVLDILERHVGFMLNACVAMHNTFPVKDLDKVDLGDRDLQSGTLGNDAQVGGGGFRCSGAYILTAFLVGTGEKIPTLSF